MPQGATTFKFKKTGGGAAAGRKARPQARKNVGRSSKDRKKATAAINARIEEEMTKKVSQDGGTLHLVKPSKSSVPFQKFNPKKQGSSRR